MFMLVTYFPDKPVYLAHGVDLTVQWICLQLLLEVYLWVILHLAHHAVARPRLSRGKHGLVAGFQFLQPIKYQALDHDELGIMRLYDLDVCCIRMRIERQIFLQAVSYVCGATKPAREYQKPLSLMSATR